MVEMDDDSNDSLRCWCRLIKPRPDWEYEPDAIVGHGITPEAAAESGIDLKLAMAHLVSALQRVDQMCAFNADFAKKVLERSAYECGLNHEILFAETPHFCAMRQSTDIVRIPRMAPGGGWVWPKFRSAFEFFHGDDLPPIDLDPEERGIALATCVRLIYQGIMDYRGVHHDV